MVNPKLLPKQRMSRVPNNDLFLNTLNSPRCRRVEM